MLYVQYVHSIFTSVGGTGDSEPLCLGDTFLCCLFLVVSQTVIACHELEGSTFLGGGDSTHLQEVVLGSVNLYQLLLLVLSFVQHVRLLGCVRV